MVKKTTCPCGSGSLYPQCCQVFHQGELAPTAEKLMRSRYTAYYFGLSSYLKATWNKDTCPSNLQLDDTTQWVKLKIVNTKTLPNQQASVHFIATYKENGKAYKLEENSLFDCLHGEWTYNRAIV